MSGTIVHQFLLRPPSFLQYHIQVALRDPQLTAVNSNNGSLHLFLSRAASAKWREPVYCKVGGVSITTEKKYEFPEVWRRGESEMRQPATRCEMGPGNSYSPRKVACPLFLSGLNGILGEGVE